MIIIVTYMLFNLLYAISKNQGLFVVLCICVYLRSFNLPCERAHPLLPSHDVISVQLPSGPTLSPAPLIHLRLMNAISLPTPD